MLEAAVVPKRLARKEGMTGMEDLSGGGPERREQVLRRGAEVRVRWERVKNRRVSVERMRMSLKNV